MGREIYIIKSSILDALKVTYLCLAKAKQSQRMCYEAIKVQPVFRLCGPTTD